MVTYQKEEFHIILMLCEGKLCHFLNLKKREFKISFKLHQYCCIVSPEFQGLSILKSNFPLDYKDLKKQAALDKRLHINNKRYRR